MNESRVSVGRLKARLSHYLRRAGAGEPVVVTDRGRPVARLVGLEGETALETALYLLNEKRASLAELEKKYKASIIIKGRPELKPDAMEISFQKMEKTALPKPTGDEEKSLKKAEDVSMAPPQTAQEKVSDAPEKPSTTIDGGGRKKSSARKPPRKKPAVKTPDKQSIGPEAETSAPVAEDISPEPATEVKPLPKAAGTDSPIKVNGKPVETTSAKSSQENQPAQEGKQTETGIDKPSQPRRKPRPRRRPAKKPDQKDTDASTQPVSTEEAVEKPVSGEKKSAQPEAKSRPRPSRSRRPSKNKQVPQHSPHEKEKMAENTPPSKVESIAEAASKNSEPSTKTDN